MCYQPLLSQLIKKYKEGANRTAVQSEVSSGHKAYMAHETFNNTFCATLESAGISTAGTSNLYTSAPDSFAGFNTSGCLPTISATDISNKNGTSIGAADCVLDADEFVFGAAYQKGSVMSGYYMSNEDSGPKATATGTCDQNTTSDICKTKNDCENNSACAATGLLLFKEYGQLRLLLQMFVCE